MSIASVLPVTLPNPNPKRNTNVNYKDFFNKEYLYSELFDIYYNKLFPANWQKNNVDIFYCCSSTKV